MQKLSLALAATALLSLAAPVQAAHQPGAARASLVQHVDLGAATVSATKANFRTEPSLAAGKSKVISTLKRGDKLTAIEKSKDGKWMKVKVGEQTGWIIASFVKVG